MRLRDIKVDRWYKTRMGDGKVLEAGGRFPPAVKINIVGPVPRGVVFVVPKDVEREIPEPPNPDKQVA